MNTTIMKKFVIRFMAASILAIALNSFTSDKEVLYKEQDGVRITYTKKQHTVSADQIMEYLILKIENKNKFGVTASWKLDLWYNGVCRTCDQQAPSGYEFTVDLKPGQKIEGNINKDDLMLKIWHKNIKPKTEGGLTRFEFTNLQISRN